MQRINMFVVACLDVGQGHEVLGNVNNKFVHKSWSNVKSIHVVVQVPNLNTINHKGQVHNKTEVNNTKLPFV